ncbi:MAG: xanthine phosphoribosyltransferase [Clostridiales bacterium]|nr:xanthine phosphoribosyltransferase [Clostridiales bacterium]
MKELEEKIIKEGKVLPGEVLKVGSFLNQRVDVKFLDLLGKEIAERFKDDGVTLVLTVEASGIPIAYATASALGVPMVVAKKHESINLTNDILMTSVYSYTHKQTYEIVVSKEYISSSDKVLIVDDFLAMGNALEGLMVFVKASGADLAGAAVAVEKGFQEGGARFREKGIRIESLAIVDKMTDDGQIAFRSEG